MGDYHVRFCERLRGETPLCLLGALCDKTPTLNLNAKGSKIRKGSQQKKMFKKTQTLIDDMPPVVIWEECFV